jgi:diguanylate cyclase (GGDEF)-like protein
MGDQFAKTAPRPTKGWLEEHGAELGDDAEPPTERAPSDPPLGALSTEKAISLAPAASSRRATLTVMTGMQAGQVFTLERTETVVGRGIEAHVTLDDPSISRRHCSIRREANGQFTVHDLGSMNGTSVGGTAAERLLLASGDRIQVGPNVLVRFAVVDEAEEALLRRLYESSTRDALTGAYNRKYFVERLASEVAYARRHGADLAVVLLDVDHFKQVNDAHGHLAGDAVLRALADEAQRHIRREDVFARFGGEEFVVLARSGLHLDAGRFAERLRAAIEALDIQYEGVALRVTVSLGVARLAECDGDRSEELLQLADERLYGAKSAGRNRVADR